MHIQYRNIPIFLPELACPHRCVFCNQSHISGQDSIPNPNEVPGIIEKYLETIPLNNCVQVAFFGGSFTGLPIDLQQQFLEKVQPYIQHGRVDGIRLSTRPDYISNEILQMLAGYNVREIELGAQSAHNDVLRMSGRGHDFESIRNASRLILQYGFRLGLQMMIGLPGDSFEKSFETAKTIISLGAHSTRIYPTLVIQDTPLAKLFEKGEYVPLTLDEAIAWTKEIYLLFEKNNITVLRTGLHASEDLVLGKHLLAGPFHPSFKELVLTKIWCDIFDSTFTESSENLTIYVSSVQINFAIGHKSSNRNMLLKLFKKVEFVVDNALQNYEFTYSYN